MAVSIGDEFKPGKTVEASGIYRVIHEPYHAPPHEVTCVYGKSFPRCQRCANPRFVLLRGAPYVEQNEHFKTSAY